MPWCSSCDRFLAPASVATDGTCPRCGRAVDPGRARPPAGTAAAGASDADLADTVASAADAGERAAKDEPLDPLPWHFKLLVAAITVYLGYRAFQGIEWLVGLG
ncbi:MAG TPA: hypothetical protein VFW06_00190 [Acidimicrobiia bacterium]|nr:hypothetical protein [Acidimicrobiia bacterium]